MTSHEIKEFLRICSLNQIVLLQGCRGDCSLMCFQIALDEKVDPKDPSIWIQRYLSFPNETSGTGIVVIRICSDSICGDLAEGKFQPPFLVASATLAESLRRSRRGPVSPTYVNNGPKEVQESNQNIASWPFPNSHCINLINMSFSCTRLRTDFDSLGESSIIQKGFLWNTLDLSQETHRESAFVNRFQACFSRKTSSNSSKCLIPRPPLVMFLFPSR